MKKEVGLRDHWGPYAESSLVLDQSSTWLDWTNRRQHKNYRNSTCLFRGCRSWEDIYQ